MATMDDDAADAVESADKYYRGTIHKLSRSAQRGTIRSASGRNIPFMFMHVTMVGPHQRFEDLREGQDVGYDVSWTSKGLRVSVIRIPD
jgi:cold shock CspA family protein